MTKDKTAFEKWECFCDEANYHKWAVRDANGDRMFNSAIHVETKEEAEFLVKRLNALTITPEDVERCADIVNGAEYGYIGGGYYGVLNPKDVAQAVLTEFVKVRG